MRIWGIRLQVDCSKLEDIGIMKADKDVANMNK